MDRCHGQVVVVGPYFRYFRVAYVDSNFQVREVFVSRKSVVPDKIGRVSLTIGAYVSFVLLPNARDAAEVQDESEYLLFPIDPETHREFGVIHDLKTNTRGQIYGFIRRGDEPGRDLLSFRASDIISEGAEDIQIGDTLEYGIGTYDGKIMHSSEGQFIATSYRAVGICTCFKDDEIPTPDEVAPQEAPAKDLEKVYTSAERKMSLRELISRK